jgi:hypothetical protein
MRIATQLEHLCAPGADGQPGKSGVQKHERYSEEFLEARRAVWRMAREGLFQRKLEKILFSAPL